MLLSHKMLKTAQLTAVNVIHSNEENIYLFLGLQLILKSSWSNLKCNITLMHLFL